MAGLAVVALHGGGIEPGSSEIANDIAGEESSFYAFEGLKAPDNTDPADDRGRVSTSRCA
jgi:phage replication-related protein YjqB (UPF0714/DUF867 family)